MLGGGAAWAVLGGSAGWAVLRCGAASMPGSSSEPAGSWVGGEVGGRRAVSLVCGSFVPLAYMGGAYSVLGSICTLPCWPASPPLPSHPTPGLLSTRRRGGAGAGVRVHRGSPGGAPGAVRLLHEPPAGGGAGLVVVRESWLCCDSWGWWVETTTQVLFLLGICRTTEVERERECVCIVALPRWCCGRCCEPGQPT